MSIKKHTAYNLFGTVIPVAVSLITIPIYIDVVGESRYGVLAIAWLLLGYFGLFDLGLGRATAQRIAMLSNAKPEERSETFWTALAMNSALGILGALIMWPAALYFFGNHFSVDADLKSEVLEAVPWLALAVPIATMSGVLSGTLQGLSKFLELNVISVSGSALLQVIPLSVAVLHGPDLTWLIPATILTRMCVTALLFLRCYSSVLAGHPFKVSKALSVGLLQFGGWVTISSVIGPMMVILDRFVIGAQLGARYVTFYTVPFQLAQRTNLIPVALSSALFPNLAQAGLGEEGRELAVKALRTLATIITPMFLIGIFLVDWFLSFWLGDQFASKASLVGQILLLGFWGNAFARVALALLQAAGRPDVGAKAHLIELIPYFALLYFGLEYFGIAGAAVAFSVRASVDGIILMYCANIFKRSIRFLATPAVLMVLAVITASSGGPPWVLTGVGVILFSICLYWVFVNMPEELARFVRRYKLKY